MKKIVVFLSLVLQLSAAFAESPFEPRLVNYDLVDQLNSDEEQGRFIPQGDAYSVAADILLWKYWPDTSSYYHGPGFWVDTYFEYRPVKRLDINGKFLFANGSSSFGYNAAAGFKPFLGVSWNPYVGDDWDLVLRFFDLDRMTLGAGLFFQDREMSGFFLGVAHNHWHFDVALPGTSVLNLTGDLYSAQMYHRSSVNDVGLHAFFAPKLGRLTPNLSNPAVLDLTFFNLSPVASLFMRSRDNSWALYNFEAATRDEEYAFLAGLGLQRRQQCTFCYQIFAQYRHYDEDILGLLGGATAFEYIPYSVHIRDYHNAINILRTRAEVESYSLNLNFKINFSDRWALESLNEVGRAAYQNLNNDDFLWYRASVNFCPQQERLRNCLKFFAGNKILRINGLERSFFETSSIFKRADVFGFEAFIYL